MKTNLRERKPMFY